MKEIVDELLEVLGKNYTDVAKQGIRHIPTISYGNLLERIIEDKGSSSLSEIFPEMSRVVSAKILLNIFPIKNSKEHWFTFLLSVLNKKHCSRCNITKHSNEFHSNTLKLDGKESLCKDCRNLLRKATYLNNRDTELAQCKLYKTLNSEIIKEKNKVYYEEHKQEAFARSAKRRAMRLHATVPWSNYDEINLIYTKCPESYHVDHIIPLQGELVCGLHVEHNLQYLTAKENLSKGNRFDTASYSHTTEYTPPYKVPSIEII